MHGPADYRGSQRQVRFAQTPQPHPALDHSKVAPLLAALRKETNIVDLCIKFVPSPGVRATQARHARGPEFDLPPHANQPVPPNRDPARQSAQGLRPAHSRVLVSRGGPFVEPCFGGSGETSSCH
jgi:hypothetical protein